MAKTQVSWTLDEVEVLQSHPFAEDLLARLPRHTSVAISSKRRSLGIYMSREQRSAVRLRSQCHMSKRLIDQDLTLNCLPDSVFQVLVGSILGGGCVYAARGGECHFQERHGDKQVEYLCWKQEMLKIFHAKDAEKVKPHGKWRSCILRTGVHPIFTQIRRDWYNTRLAGVEKRHKSLSMRTSDSVCLVCWCGISMMVLVVQITSTYGLPAGLGHQRIWSVWYPL